MDRQSASPAGSPGARGRDRAIFAALVVVFTAFTAYTIFVGVDYGLVGFLEATVDNAAVIQVGIDLMISLVIALSFVRGDARRRGLPFIPYLVATLCTGSIGLLAYLLHRTWPSARAPTAAGSGVGARAG
jgi:hypothetical protein